MATTTTTTTTGPDRQAAAVPSPAAPAPDPDFNVADMALYGLQRARDRLDALRHKPRWEPADTASFDCMHYLGDAALHAAARALDLQPGARVVDVGAGFSATGRFLHRHYGADVTGVELQAEIHAMAEAITARSGMAAHVRSVNGDFTRPAAEGARGPLAVGGADHVVSFLCILHIPARAQVFGRAAALLRAGGSIYVEDFFARRGRLDGTAARLLRDVVSCPYLPSRERYVADLEAAGFGDVRFEEMTDEWADFVHARAVEYGQSADPEPSLRTFYDTVDGLFQSGQLGGARIMATKV